MSLKEMYERVIKHYGNEHQLKKAQEELDELKNEIEIAIINGTPNRNGIFTELVDVLNVIIQLIIIYKFQFWVVRKGMKEKMERTIKRMEE